MTARASIRSCSIDPVLLLALVNVTLHLAFYNTFEYHRDELLYFSLGLHPDFGFATVPPLIGWLATSLQQLFGFSLFAVKVIPAMLSGVMVLLVAAITAELGGNQYARLLAAIGIIITPFSLRTYFLFMPVFLDVFFWTILLFFLIRFLNTNHYKYWIVFGIFAGVAMLNKYLVALLLFSVIVSLPFFSSRLVFKRKPFYYCWFVAFIIFSPNLIWQLTHGLPVINHMKELNASQLVYVKHSDFLIDQLLMAFYSSIFTISGLIYLSFNKNAEKFRILALVSVLTIAILFFLRGKSYYTLGIFPMLIAAGAVSISQKLLHPIPRIILPVLIIILTIPILPFGLPVFRPTKMADYFKHIQDQYNIDLGRRFEDGSIHSLPQDYADMIGWEELTAITAKAYNLVPEKQKCLIYAENYGQAASIQILGKKYKLPEAVCFQESFHYWIPKSFNPDIEYFIYINKEPGVDVRKIFSQIHKIGQISNPDARELGTAVYLCSKPTTSFNEFWKKRINHLNENY
ncbi:MAG: glycosyltransferase family 39 protein [Bacteroidetes bacterium]|nr:glycosyltransferase family 39 protein [Bacteroidota bacterium]